MTTDYSVFHVEKYGHGRIQMNDLPDDRKVVIADHDGYYDVYECDSDDEAAQIAQWYLAVGYERYPADVRIERQTARYYSVEINDD